MKYTSVNEYLKNKYGEKVYKLSIDAGMTCPNRDGTIGRGGCIFCSEGGSGDFTFGAEKPYACTKKDIKLQLDKAKALISSKSDCKKFIAYFQAYTNTYAPIDYLKEVFYAAIECPEIEILSIATRCDCISEEVLSLLRELNRIKPVWVEMGLQSMHLKTLEFIKCGYTFEDFKESTLRLDREGIEVIAHLILGLPGETEEMMLQSLDSVLALPIQGIKLQLLHILKGTELARIYEENPFHIFSMEEYCSLVVRCLKRIPPDIVIHRLTGDGPRRLLIEPEWSTDKKRVLNTINKSI
ncbi:MAG: TIGR01212 family radical SAM protein [Lachnospiraceae bacterium]|nr:TIGR01212 family radical SAM protein [Lachnospiraceae bacterium]